MPTRGEIWAKRSLDLAIAIPAFVIALPVFAMIALLIRLDSKGPVFFRQTRIGLGGRAFEILKFRTMHVLENGPIQQVVANDPRLTSLGLFLRVLSLDELPQLINILRGDMSLVGPRPHACAHDAEFELLFAHYPLRRRVKPGITGWAQIHGCRGPTHTVEAMRRRTAFDIWYVANVCTKLDLQILWRTPREVFRGRNVL